MWVQWVLFIVANIRFLFHETQLWTVRIHPINPWLAWMTLWFRPTHSPCISRREGFSSSCWDVNIASWGEVLSLVLQTPVFHFRMLWVHSRLLAPGSSAPRVQRAADRASDWVLPSTWETHNLWLQVSGLPNPSNAGVWAVHLWDAEFALSLCLCNK